MCVYFVMTEKALAGVVRTCASGRMGSCGIHTHLDMVRQIWETPHYIVGPGRTCPCSADRCNDSPWESLLQGKDITTMTEKTHETTNTRIGYAHVATKITDVGSTEEKMSVSVGEDTALGAERLFSVTMGYSVTKDRVTKEYSVTTANDADGVLHSSTKHIHTLFIFCLVVVYCGPSCC